MFRRSSFLIAAALVLALFLCAKNSASTVSLPVGSPRHDAPERSFGPLHRVRREAVVRTAYIPPIRVVEPVAPPVVYQGGKHWPDPVNWDAIAACESGGRWDLKVGSFDGGLQFLPSTWLSNGGADFAPFAWGATREQQIVVAERLYKARGDLGAWPTCGARG